jgi:hypothetical protein
MVLVVEPPDEPQAVDESEGLDPPKHRGIAVQMTALRLLRAGVQGVPAEEQQLAVGVAEQRADLGQRPVDRRLDR